MPGKGRYARWECVSCGRVAPCELPLLVHGWLNYGGGRLCAGCRDRLAGLPVGTTIDLGAGCRLVKVSEDRS